ncbi:YfgM family protein [Thiohalorhabdus sp. Cl-TMA]|uniref:Ancillary SecYEG translocon subunit n=1 Tax=Thiohalorhabdus methylotrophus TaxID=3242694 RepID=A0ABV4TU63_9GAMM
MEEHLDLEEGRRIEALKDFAHRYRWLLVALAVAVAVGIGAGYGYYRHQSAQLLAASETYGSAVQALQSGREGDAREALRTLMTEYEGTPYAAFARVFRARLLHQGDQSARALEVLKPLASGSVGPPEAQHIGVEERARIQWEQGNAQTALNTLRALEGEAYLPSYFLLKGDLLSATGKPEAAGEAYREARTRPGAGPLSQVIQARIEQLSGNGAPSGDQERGG